jgi:hypothetical protein
MAEVISLENRLRKQKEETLSQEKKKRLDAFRISLQCACCPMKCAKCGSQLEAPQPHIISQALPLGLCQGCWEEYRLYEKVAAGPCPVEGQDFYHNPEWAGVWKAWLDYQKSLQQYRKSKEFMTLMEELSRE